MTITETVKILPKGQITIPKDIRTAIGVNPGDRLMISYRNGVAVLETEIQYALHNLQDALKDSNQNVGLDTEEEILNFTKDIRQELNKRRRNEVSN